MEAQVEYYKNLSGNSGVLAYESELIQLQFNSKIILFIYITTTAREKRL